MDGEYSRVPDTRKSDTQKSVLKGETSTLRHVPRPTQKPTTFEGKSSWDAYKTQFEIVAEINGWEGQEKATFLAAGDMERLVRLAYPSGTSEMLEAFAKDQIVDAVHDDDIRLQIAQSRSPTLRQALEIALELESFALANKRRSRYVREVRVEEPRYDSNCQAGPWNGVLDQLKALTQEMQNFTREYTQQRARDSRTPSPPPKKCWTCQGDHLQRNSPDFVLGKRNSRRNEEDDVWKFRGQHGGQNQRG